MFPADDPSIKPLSLKVAYGCEGKKTTTIPASWAPKFATKGFLGYYTFQNWFNFLSRVSRDNDTDIQAKKLVGVNSADKNFFWQRFFDAYLYFLAMSRMNPEADHTFLTFLDNLKIARIFFIQTILDVFQKQWGWLDALPGVSLSSFGEETLNLLPLFNQDPNTVNLDTFLIDDYRKYLNLETPGYRAFPFTSWRKNKYIPIVKPYSTLVDKVLEIVQQPGFWQQLQSILSNSWGIKSLFFNNQKYSLEHLINTLPQSGYVKDWTDNFNNLTNVAVAELVKIIFGNSSDTAQGVDSVAKLKARFDETKTKFLTDLKTALDRIVSFDSTITQLTIKGKPYDLNHLIAAKDQILENDFATKNQQAFTQAKILVNDLIISDQINISNQIQTALDQFNNEKLNTLWTELRPKLVQYANLSSFQITIGSGDNAKVYSLEQLFQDQKATTGSKLPNGKFQLQTLVNDRVSVQQITTQLDNLVERAKTEKEEAEKEAKEEKTKKTNLAIGLGTAGGVVALAGAGGFAYWFVKIRKS